MVFLTRATRRNNPEDTILHSHRHENLKSYIEPFIFTAVKTSNLVEKVRFWALTALDIKLMIFWHVMPCSLVARHQWLYSFMVEHILYPENGSSR
jgi:hypothetical protein